MLIIVLLGVLVIGFYRYGEKNDLNSLPWLIALVSAYCSGYFGFYFIGLNVYPNLFDTDLERLGYPALSAIILVLFVLLLMLIFVKKKKKREIENENILE